MAKATKKNLVKKTAIKKVAKKKKVAQSATNNVATPNVTGTVPSTGAIAKSIDTAPKKFRARIRMYRHGLGDCFLLSFPGKEHQLVHFMIDCGVVLGTANPQPVMTKVAENIKSVTDGTIDVLTITHEHWDHLSGFDEGQAKGVFDSVEFKNLWLAWTEDPTCDLANSLREEREQKRKAAIAARKRAKELKLTDQVERLTGLLGFFGAVANESGEGDEEADAGGGTAGALNYLKRRCDPTIVPTGGKPLVIPGVENVRVYVLGPPMHRQDLNKANPSKGEGYELMSGGSLGLATAVIDACEETENKKKHSLPFDPRSGRALSGMPAKHPYRLPRNNWRNIDHDWLAVGERLALQLDSATNNTSLVLAFEFVDTGDVMLFVGDAQAGNWRTWDSLSFEVKDAEGGKQTVSAGDLLTRTIFYKVGHHGSHNATLKAKGLERMKSKRLAAVIPVDVNVAHDVKGWKRMPLPSITETLKKKCAVLFQSDAVTTVGEGASPPQFIMSAEKYDVYMRNKATKKNEVVRTEHLYCDYFL